MRKSRYIFLNPMSFLFSFLHEHARELLALLGFYAIGQLTLFLVAKRLINKRGNSESEQRKRLRSLSRLLYGTGNATLLFVVIFWILKLINIDPTPIIASAGVLGLALGFGAQTLVKDFLSGVFIIIEGQYGVDDLVKINGTEGRVKHIGIRSTVLEDTSKNLIYIPNGSITTVTNLHVE